VRQFLLLCVVLAGAVLVADTAEARRRCRNGSCGYSYRYSYRPYYRYTYYTYAPQKAWKPSAQKAVTAVPAPVVEAPAVPVQKPATQK